MNLRQWSQQEVLNSVRVAVAPPALPAPHDPLAMLLIEKRTPPRGGNCTNEAVILQLERFSPSFIRFLSFLRCSDFELSQQSLSASNSASSSAVRFTKTNREVQWTHGSPSAASPRSICASWGSRDRSCCISEHVLLRRHQRCLVFLSSPGLRRFLLRRRRVYWHHVVMRNWLTPLVDMEICDGISQNVFLTPSHWKHRQSECRSQFLERFSHLLAI